MRVCYRSHFNRSESAYLAYGRLDLTYDLGWRQIDVYFNSVISIRNRSRRGDYGRSSPITVVISDILPPFAIHSRVIALSSVVVGIYNWTRGELPCVVSDYYILSSVCISYDQFTNNRLDVSIQVVVPTTSHLVRTRPLTLTGYGADGIDRAFSQHICYIVCFIHDGMEVVAPIGRKELVAHFFAIE